ncbi:MAG: hypothetical protein ASARMPREDX12_004855 [Alectoria sarmentosa]|nr:MAG: hypothetical protein ASARMPRED_000175 [Alectoria sarmentosa]CAD6572006.1 MAG: hypothetical protein ASARMPREDX12_004855 [Alectoria sarmentosa]
MLSRGTSSASQRPRRAKSSPSVRPGPIIPMASSTNDAETTHQQALTAANLAFERANEREMAKKAPNGQDSMSIANNDGGPRLGRKQSVRFTGPTAIPSRNRSITRREAPGSRTGHHPYENQLQSQSRNIEPSISSNERTSIALAQPTEEFGENDNASVPSSYRRLRKSKSMFSPGKTPSAVFSDGIPYSGRHFHRQSLQSSDAYNEPLRVPDRRLRKSYSFLRGVTDRISTSSRQYVTSDAAVQLARDQYLRQLEQQRLKEQPSFLGLSNRRRSHKAFRRTVRTNSTNSYGSAIASPSASVEPPKIKDLNHRVRSLSQTIKKKIKWVFKRSPDTEDTIPVQQIKATHPHYGDYISTSDGKEQRYPPVPEPDAELLLRVGSRESVTYTAPVFVDKSARPGSIRSAHSDDDESNGKSRVTSWTDSTAANTINIPQALERKRLSIIKEDGGPHQPSFSARQHEGTSDGYASFHQPVRQSSAGRVSGPIDTQRMFSALQKKIDENNREAALDDTESGTDSSSDHQKARLSTRPPRRTSSIREGAKAKSRSLSRSRGANISTSVIFSPSAMESFNDNFYQHESQNTHRIYQQHDFLDLQKGLTPQQVAEMNEHGTPLIKRPLREVKSAFFPPSMRIERSNPSPYRRVMHASSEIEAGSQSSVNFGDRPRSEGPPCAVTTRLRNGSVTGSDSIYSRSSGGDTPKIIRDSMSLALSESSGEAGTAIIMTGHPGNNEQSAPPVVIQQGYSSVASSGNWRNFMATQVASLEDYGTRQEQTDETYPVRDSGHRREKAQVNSDEVTIGRLQSPADVLNQPLAIIQGHSKSQQASKHKVSRSLGDRPPLMSLDPSSNAGNVTKNENVPLSRGSEHLRKTSNVENERRPPNRVHEPPGGLPQQKSHSSLKMQTEQRSSPTTANVRYSPERAERLRRLKSSSGTSLGKPLSQNENQASRHTPSGEKDHDSDGPNMGSNVPQAQAGNNHKLVDSFLKGRRSVMRISEESGTDAAFL